MVISSSVNGGGKRQRQGKRVKEKRGLTALTRGRTGDGVRRQEGGKKNERGTARQFNHN